MFKDDKSHDCENCPVFKTKLGTTCYMSNGTRCFDEVQGSYMQKIDLCRSKCKFYEQMMGCKI